MTTHTGLLLFFFALMTSCTLRPTEGSGGSGGSGGTAEGSGGGGGGANTPVACQDCRANAAKGSCSAAMAECQANPSCVGLDQCLTFTCDGPEADCYETCVAANPAGKAPYDAAKSCLECEACPQCESWFCQ